MNYKMCTGQEVSGKHFAERKVMQHCFGRKGTGGPVVAFERFLAHSKREYSQIRQLNPNGGINFELLNSFVRDIKSSRPNLIHVRGLGNEGFHAVLAAKLAGVPNILVSIHGSQRDLKRARSSFRRFVVVHVLERLTLLLATHVATVCDFAGEREYLAPYRKKYVGAVANGVDFPSEELFRKGKVRISATADLGEEWTIGVCVSRLTIEKGYLVLAEALHLIDDSTKNFCLLVVGGGDEDEEIRAAFGSLKNVLVRFLGHQEDVRTFLQAGDFFVFPSLHENLSNALIEALAHGLPAIATSVGGNTEVLNKGGGVLVPVSDPKALSIALSRLIEKKEIRLKLATEARKNAVENYSVENMTAKWEGLYDKILGA